VRGLGKRHSFKGGSGPRPPVPCTGRGWRYFPRQLRDKEALPSSAAPRGTWGIGPLMPTDTPAYTGALHTDYALDPWHPRVGHGNVISCLIYNQERVGSLGRCYAGSPWHPAPRLAGGGNAVACAASGGLLPPMASSTLSECPTHGSSSLPKRNRAREMVGLGLKPPTPLHHPILGHHHFRII
jgi:hypothetical protein